VYQEEGYPFLSAALAFSRFPHTIGL